MTWLTPVGLAVVDCKPWPPDEDTIKAASIAVGRRILALMLQEDKPVHLAGGRPETDGSATIEWDEWTKLEENKKILKVGVEVDLNRCYDVDYQRERVATARAAAEEALRS